MKMSSRAALPLLVLAAGCVLAQAPAPEKPLGEVYASDATLTGSLVLTGGGMQVMSGAAVNAGKDPAVLRLARGGELRICAATKIGLYAASNGRDLLFSLGAGGIEVHYRLAASADLVLTPDFRLQLPGPGEFHFAIGSDQRGNTCVKSLSGNTASVIVTELTGGGTYQVKPSEQVLFRGGSLQNATAEVIECGCPAPPMPRLRAGIEPEEAPPAPPAARDAVPAPMPASKLPVEAPLVFRAEAPSPPGPAPEAVRPRLASIPVTFPVVAIAPPAPPAELAVATPPPPQKKKKKGFFSRLGAFFAAVAGRPPR